MSDFLFIEIVSTLLPLFTIISGKNVVDDGGYGYGAGLGSVGGLYSYPLNTEK